jgi:hypothetical protein
LESLPRAGAAQVFPVRKHAYTKPPSGLTLVMRQLKLLLAALLVCLPAISQSPGSDDAMLTKTRGLYDAPFTRQLVSFDCSVKFDWKQHFVNTLGAARPDSKAMKRASGSLRNADQVSSQ